MKSFKGFKPNMTCRGYKYEEGKTYTTPDAEVCITGFHACEYPLDCFEYYPPAKSVYHKVEQSGEIDRLDLATDTKVASTEIKVCERLSFKEIAEAAISMRPDSLYQTRETDAVASMFNGSVVRADGNRRIAATTGRCSIAISTNDYSYNSAAVATGMYSVAITESEETVSVVTNTLSMAIAKDAYSVAVATGGGSAVSVEHKGSIGVAWGYDCKAKGVLNSWLVLTDEGCDDAKLIKIDGIKYMPDTWYVLKDGVVKEVND